MLGSGYVTAYVPNAAQDHEPLPHYLSVPEQSLQLPHFQLQPCYVHPLICAADTTINAWLSDQVHWPHSREGPLWQSSATLTSLKDLIAYGISIQTHHLRNLTISIGNNVVYSI